MTGPALPLPRRLASSGPPPTGSQDTGAGPISAALLARPVLVIEDEAMIAWMIESLLEDIGFADITVVPNGEGAIAEARRRAPALIVSDINLGSATLDGIGAVSTIVRQSRAFVVFITGHADDEARRRIAAGVPGALLLRKPVETRQLEDAIRQFDRTNPAH